MLTLPRGVPARIDPELGVVGCCPGCGEDWPEDEDFWRPGSRYCRACVFERSEERRRSVAEAARRYRAKRRA